MAIQTWLVVNDVQIPWQDKPVVDLMLAFARDIKPYGVILNGDITDCYQISEFTKNPLHTPGLNREIREAGWLMAALDDLKIKEKWWLGGNHEDRLRRYVWAHAPAFGDIAQMTFPKMFGLGEYGFKWKEYGGYVMLGKLMVTHGSRVLKHSGQSAKAHFEKYGTSILHGHTHRMGAYYKRDMRGIHGAWENGCLCRLDPEYVQHPDWAQGFSIVHVGTNGFFNVQQIPILNRRELYYGKDRYAL